MRAHANGSMGSPAAVQSINQSAAAQSINDINYTFL
jgi:hypothetical protein